MKINLLQYFCYIVVIAGKESTTQEILNSKMRAHSGKTNQIEYGTNLWELIIELFPIRVSFYCVNLTEPNELTRNSKNDVWVRSSWNRQIPVSVRTSTFVLFPLFLKRFLCRKCHFPFTINLQKYLETKATLHINIRLWIPSFRSKNKRNLHVWIDRQEESLFVWSCEALLIPGKLLYWEWGLESY